MQDLERTSGGGIEPVAPTLLPELVGRPVVRLGGRLRTDLHPRRRAAGLIGLLGLLLALRLAVLSGPTPSTSPMPDCHPEHQWDQRCEWFDSLLALGQHADREADAEPSWLDVRPIYSDDLDKLTTIILTGLRDYGFANPHRPVSVKFEDYGADATQVAGRYYETEDRVTLNIRYITDPVWERRGYLKVLTHELIHAQGYTSEVQTETIALQIVAALGNQGEPGFRRAVLEEIRNDALWSAYDIAVHHAYFVADDNVRPPCETGLDDHGYTCMPEGPPNLAMQARLDAVRRQVFDPIELRYSDYKVRWWEQRQIVLLMDAYVMPPLAYTLQAYCRTPHALPNSASWLPTVKGVAVATSLPTDEGDYLLADTGWSCPPMWSASDPPVDNSSPAATDSAAPRDSLAPRNNFEPAN